MKTEAKIQAIIFFASLFLACTFCLAQPPAQPAQKKNPGASPPVKEEELQGEAQVLKLGTTQIVLNVTVTNAGGRFISGLTSKDFRVFEDKMKQEIVSFTTEETPFAAAILLDTSGSMTPKMSLARAACARFAAGIREGDTVAIYGFGGTKVKLMQDFTEVRDVDPLVWDTDADGNTPLYDAIIQACEALSKREEKRRAILLISDGADTSSRASFDQALRIASTANVTIYSVDMSDAALGQGVARDNGAQIIKDFAVKTGGQFFQTPGGGKLRDAFEQTVDELRHQYTIVYEPTNEKEDGKWRTVELTLRKPAFTARTRPGYYAHKTSAKAKSD